jgi:hypothetical protein
LPEALPDNVQKESLQFAIGDSLFHEVMITDLPGLEKFFPRRRLGIANGSSAPAALAPATLADWRLQGYNRPHFTYQD